MTGHGCHVCVVDDDEAVRSSLEALLTAHGFSAETFGSAEEFLESFDPDSPSCLLVDISMPGMDGLALQRVMRERAIDYPVVVLTGNGTVSLAVQAVKEGALDFLEKPVEADRVLDAIRRGCRHCATERLPALYARRRLEALTQREREVLDQVVEGHTTKVIARHLDISPRTVEVHRANMMAKMGAGSLAELIRLTLAADR